MKLLTKASYDGNPNQRELDNLQIAYEAACESIVLLKNEGALPFSHKNVALYGAGASMTIKGGTGSGEVNERHCVTVLEGLEDRGFTITTKKWIDSFAAYYEKAKAEYAAEKRKRVNIFKLDSIMQMLFDNFRLPAGPAITEATDTDSCVYVVSRQAGEGGDRKAEKGDYLLSDEELAHIRFCAAHYEKFVLVINCGSSMELAALDDIPGINAILYICQLGSEGGHAVADILSGAVSPSGKLSDTWAKHYDDIPFAREYSYLNGDLKNEYYKEGIYVGYRYFDSFGISPPILSVSVSAIRILPSALNPSLPRVLPSPSPQKQKTQESARAKRFYSCMPPHRTASFAKNTSHSAPSPRPVFWHPVRSRPWSLPLTLPSLPAIGNLTTAMFWKQATTFSVWAIPPGTPNRCLSSP